MSCRPPRCPAGTFNQFCGDDELRPVKPNRACNVPNRAGNVPNRARKEAIGIEPRANGQSPLGCTQRKIKL